MAVEPSHISVLHAIIFGIVQGATEFLPISSTAHLRILPDIVGMERDPGAAFTAVIQLGTIAAVFIYFAKDLWRALRGWIGWFFGAKDTVEARMGWGVFWGSVPIIVLGLLFKDWIKSEEVRSLYVVAVMLIVMGLLMAYSERVGKKDRGMKKVTVKDGIIVGLWQCIALIPGASRSGSTITGALFQGMDRPTAARFSFLLSVPSITGAGLYQLIDERKNIMGENLVATLVATLVSFLVGYAAIAWLIKFLQTRGVAVFVWYRVALGVLLIILIQAGLLEAQAVNPDESASPSIELQAQSPDDHMKQWEEAMTSQREQADKL